MKILPAKLIFALLVTILSVFSCKAPGTAPTNPQRLKTIAVGETAPDFTLKNQDQMNVSLSDFRGKKNVALVFFPLAFTPV